MGSSKDSRRSGIRIRRSGRPLREVGRGNIPESGIGFFDFLVFSPASKTVWI